MKKYLTLTHKLKDFESLDKTLNEFAQDGYEVISVNIKEVGTMIEANVVYVKDVG